MTTGDLITRPLNGCPEEDNVILHAAYIPLQIFSSEFFWKSYTFRAVFSHPLDGVQIDSSEA